MRTQDARQIPITDYLDRIGAKFARKQQGTNGLEYVYHSPARADSKPSLCVNIEKNIWSDVPVGAGGRLIELVCHIHNLTSYDVKSALAILDRIYPTMSAFSGRTSRIISNFNQARSGSLFNDETQHSALQENSATGLNKKSASIEVLEVKPLYSYPLKQYLVKERKIDLDIAAQYVKEVKCQLRKSNKTLFAIGFASGDTFAIRNKHFKGFAGTGVDIRIFQKQTKKVLLFEGFIDFLSYLTAKKIKESPFTAVVLNSSAMLDRFIQLVEQSPQVTEVDYFRDRDELNGKTTGLDTLQQLKKKLKKAKINDLSEAYPKHKDLNDWLIDHLKSH